VIDALGVGSILSVAAAVLGDGRYAFSNLYHTRKPQGAYA
jgi:hypothetical protein